MSPGLLRPYDEISREVLFALELVDPVTLSRLFDRRVEVRAQGLERKAVPIQSGRYVWWRQAENEWPGPITVHLGDLPYQREALPAPAPPADDTKLVLGERLTRVHLRPSRAYPFADGVTAIRGRLGTGDEASNPKVGIRVQLAWRDITAGQWVPPPPPPEDVDDDAKSPTPREAQTDSAGEFAVFGRVPGPPADPDINGGLLRVRLQFTQGRRNPVTRVTPADYSFLDGGGPLPPERRGRVHEGRLLERALRLGWANLQPV